MPKANAMYSVAKEPYAARGAASFTVKIDPSVRLPARAKASIAAAVGGAAAAEIARLDLGGTVAFVPRIDWPGGRIIDLGQYLGREELRGLMEGP